MSECPRCDREIGNATRCKCGWEKRHRKAENPNGYDNLPTVPCSHDDCTQNAILRMQTATGWAHFCMTHYNEYNKAQARLTCAKLGLTTADEKRKWLKTMCEQIDKKPPETLTDDEIPF